MLPISPGLQTGILHILHCSCSRKRRWQSIHCVDSVQKTTEINSVYLNLQQEQVLGRKCYNATIPSSSPSSSSSSSSSSFLFLLRLPVLCISFSHFEIVHRTNHLLVLMNSLLPQQRSDPLFLSNLKTFESR